MKRGDGEPCPVASTRSHHLPFFPRRSTAPRKIVHTSRTSSWRPHISYWSLSSPGTGQNHRPSSLAYTSPCCCNSMSSFLVVVLENPARRMTSEHLSG